ncbi:hypothetical protein GBO37_02715 [Paracoccus sp. 08]|nr:hypothetical protein [Paracoccus sp. 08]
MPVTDAVSIFGAGGPPLDEVSFAAWIAQAAPGEALVYHRGFLAVDTIGSGLKLGVKRQAELRKLAAAALRAAESDLVHLVQARLGPDHFAYVAVARPRPEPPGVAVPMRLLKAA